MESESSLPTGGGGGGGVGSGATITPMMSSSSPSDGTRPVPTNATTTPSPGHPPNVASSRPGVPPPGVGGSSGGMAATNNNNGLPSSPSTPSSAVSGGGGGGGGAPMSPSGTGVGPTAAPSSMAGRPPPPGMMMGGAGGGRPPAGMAGGVPSPSSGMMMGPPGSAPVPAPIPAAAAAAGSSPMHGGGGGGMRMGGHPPPSLHGSGTATPPLGPGHPPPLSPHHPQQQQQPPPRVIKTQVSASAGPIGIANLPNQTHRIVFRKGTTCNFMVVGESGVGKTTFINTLLSATVKSKRQRPRGGGGGMGAAPTSMNVTTGGGSTTTSRKTVSIDVKRIEFMEKGFRTQLNLVDTPGFGDYVNNRDAWVPLVDFLDGQHETYLRQEMQPVRTDMLDGRVHACLYFITPTGHTLRPLDVETMKKLSTRVNLIPVIAKADTLTPKEMAAFKRRIREAIAHHGIEIYRPPVESDTEGVTDRNRSIAEAMPYAVIGAESPVTTPDGRTVLGRAYQWGVSEVEDERHCDFKKLRNLLVRSHLLDLISTTEEVHYENFRATHLDAHGRLVASVMRKDAKHKEDEDALRRRFAERVKAKEAEFRGWEQKLIAERDKLNKDLEREHSDITALTSELKAMEERASMFAKKA